jgi:hypothetical protein|tara:strand:- start:276 stop:461 length:186 start_codon:yes stop_codon:yes gene_type:complete
MKFSWKETYSWLCALSFPIIGCAQFISDYTGIDYWSILYFGIGLGTVAVLIIILWFKKMKK